MDTTSRPWCDGPYKLIPASMTGAAPGVKLTGAASIASEMLLVHNIFIRGINCVHRQAINIGERGTAKDKLDFTNFAYQWAVNLHHHHHVEEDEIFPALNEAAGVSGLMDANVDEHKTFDEGLQSYMAYLEKVKQEDMEYDGKHLVELIDGMMPTIHSHLESEIQTLLALKQYEDKVDWPKVFGDIVGEGAKRDMSQSWYRNQLFPLVLISHDQTFENGVFSNFPPIPWIMLVAIKWIFCRTHQDWWRFAGCDGNSQPVELPFA